MSTAPISSHPAFKWAVALWFALLLGGGLMVMPAEVHANIAAKLGLATLLPDGIFGKAALAGAAALIGLLAGLVIAMRVAALNDAAADEDEGQALPGTAWLRDDTDEVVVEEETADGPRRPFNPREDIGEEGIGRAARSAPVDEEDEDEDALMALWRQESVEDHGAEESHEPVEPAVEIEPQEEAEPVETAAALPAADDEPAAVPARTESLDDLPLAALTERLAQAIADNVRRSEERPVEEEPEDPVVAFLRREANRTAPGRREPSGDDDPQAVLRSALDRLSQVGNPK